MKIVKMKVLLNLSVAMCGAVLFGQNGSNGTPIDPKLLAKIEKSRATIDLGNGLLRESKIEEAIVEFRKAIEIENTFGYFTSVGRYELAKALTVAGRLDEAIVAFKSALKWNSVRQDLTGNGPVLTLIAMDYAMVLARVGKTSEAKSIYYFGLREFNVGALETFEPVPFLVVFDPDPNATVWEYSEQKLIAAATMAKAPYMNIETTKLVEQVRSMEPSWSLPVAFQASRKLGKKREELLNIALRLTKSSLERSRIESLRLNGASAGSRPATNKLVSGAVLRQSSVAIQNSKQDLAKSHSKVAND